jgi:hypothetical protein
MENLLLFLATAFLVKLSATHRKFVTFFIGNTGCRVDLPATTATFHKSYTIHEDVMYMSEYRQANVYYGIVAVKLNREVEEMDRATDLLDAFISTFHGYFCIEHRTGFDASVTEHDDQVVVSGTDFWQDTKGIDWKVRGWTNGKLMSFLYVKNINEIDTERQDHFLKSFRFPVK